MNFLSAFDKESQVNFFVFCKTYFRLFLFLSYSRLFETFTFTRGNTFFPNEGIKQFIEEDGEYKNKWINFLGIIGYINFSIVLIILLFFVRNQNNFLTPRGQSFFIWFTLFSILNFVANYHYLNGIQVEKFFEEGKNVNKIMNTIIQTIFFVTMYIIPVMTVLLFVEPFYSSLFTP